jgi:hypothetical protein
VEFTEAEQAAAVHRSSMEPDRLKVCACFDPGRVRIVIHAEFRFGMPSRCAPGQIEAFA